jgi:2-methylcitrate dehydratase PrpD
MNMNKTIAETLAENTAALDAGGIPSAVRDRAVDLLIDVAGLCVAARNTDYMRALIAGVETGGRCTAFGHANAFSAEDAAMLNGTAAHGEDFDDTFEGGPVHSSAVVVPAVLAACERWGGDGGAALVGIVAGVEAMCRMSMVVPKAVHKSGFHPTAIFGAMGATLGVCAALKLNARQTVDALGNAGSMASGIIEYLEEGAWTKRLHVGWSAGAGLRAALTGKHGFLGPRTVFEGRHGLYNGFARSRDGDYEALCGDFGRRWVMQDITFKPYATGTMNQPYIDCALRLAKKGFGADDVADVLCETAEGYVHRLWEPLAAKHQPANDYAAKFSAPFNIAVAFVTGSAGLEAFSEKTVRDPRILRLASKVHYVIDPANPYPNAYTGHVRMRLKDGRVFEERQPHIRGGKHAPLSRAEIETKFHGNVAYGGWPRERGNALLEFARNAFAAGTIDLTAFRG